MKSYMVYAQFITLLAFCVLDVQSVEYSVAMLLESDVYHNVWINETFSLISKRAMLDITSTHNQSRTKDKKKQVIACAISIITLTENHPLIFDPDKKNELLVPEGGADIYLPENKTLFVSCTKNGKLRLRNSNVTLGDSVTLQCVREDIFTITNGTEIKYKDLECETAVTYEIRISNSEKLSKGYTLFKVGFPIDETHFVPVYAGWNNVADGVTAYVRYVVPKLSPKNRQPIWHSRKWDNTGNFVNYVGFNKKYILDDMYQPKQQMTSFSFLNNCHLDSNKTICDLKIDEEHLYEPTPFVPASSSVYSAESRSVFTYISSSPQRKAVRKGNWNLVEKQVEMLAHNLRTIRGLDVITGVFDHIKLQSTELYLFASPLFAESIALVSAVPIPKYFWKLVYRNSTLRKTKRRKHGEGIVFITVNELKVTALNIGHDYLICPHPILNFKNGGPLGQVVDGFDQNLNIDRGFTYACPVKEFVNVVKERVPGSEELQRIAEDVGDDGLLTLNKNDKKYYMA